MAKRVKMTRNESSGLHLPNRGMSQRGDEDQKGTGATVRVTANLTFEVERRLQDLKAQTGLTVPALLRRAVDDLLAHYDKYGHL